MAQSAPRSFAYYDANRKERVARATSYKLLVGDSSHQIKLTGEVKLEKLVTEKH